MKNKGRTRCRIPEWEDREKKKKKESIEEMALTLGRLIYAFSIV